MPAAGSTVNSAAAMTSRISANISQLRAVISRISTARSRSWSSRCIQRGVTATETAAAPVATTASKAPIRTITCSALMPFGSRSTVMPPASPSRVAAISASAISVAAAEIEIAWAPWRQPSAASPPSMPPAWAIFDQARR